ncbi:hypothetical protein HPB47_009167 [Ixodes persulcatus]|uniref:Uncharacterized protein n=1 Tax=Ixodes persulcatus TaxID=34615 RepID=A0AC60P2S2_IXOPE|nr:hypothetical protein HPB47_009167 [Ixodes persulcatus]
MAKAGSDVYVYFLARSLVHPTRCSSSSGRDYADVGMLMSSNVGAKWSSSGVAALPSFLDTVVLFAKTGQSRDVSWLRGAVQPDLVLREVTAAPPRHDVSRRPEIGAQRVGAGEGSQISTKAMMNIRKFYLLVSAASAILTLGSSTPLSEASEPRNAHLLRFARELPTQHTEESLRSCLVQSGFKNVHCNTENGFVRCLSGGFDYTPTGNIIAIALGVAIGVICVAAFGCYCWTKSGRRKEAAAAAAAVQQMPHASRRPPVRGNTSIGFINSMATPATIGSGFHRL